MIRSENLSHQQQQDDNNQYVYAKAELVLRQVQAVEQASQYASGAKNSTTSPWKNKDDEDDLTLLFCHRDKTTPLAEDLSTESNSSSCSDCSLAIDDELFLLDGEDEERKNDMAPAKAGRTFFHDGRDCFADNETVPAIDTLLLSLSSSSSSNNNNNNKKDCSIRSDVIQTCLQSMLRVQANAALKCRNYQLQLDYYQQALQDAQTQNARLKKAMLEENCDACRAKYRHHGLGVCTNRRGIKSSIQTTLSTTTATSSSAPTTRTPHDSSSPQRPTYQSVANKVVQDIMVDTTNTTTTKSSSRTTTTRSAGMHMQQEGGGFLSLPPWVRPGTTTAATTIRHASPTKRRIPLSSSPFL